MSGGRIELRMAALNPALYERLGPVQPLIVANPWLRPAR